MPYTPSFASSTATLISASSPKSKDVPQRDYEAALCQLSASYGYGCHLPAPQPQTNTKSSSSFWKFGEKFASSPQSSTPSPRSAEKRTCYPQPQYKDCEAALGDLLNTYGAPGSSAGPVSRHAK